jgi:hypothetical protein
LNFIVTGAKNAPNDSNISRKVLPTISTLPSTSAYALLLRGYDYLFLNYVLMSAPFKSAKEILHHRPTSQIMLRRSPSILVLGSGDIREFEVRERLRKHLEAEGEDRPAKGQKVPQPLRPSQIPVGNKLLSALEGRDNGNSSPPRESPESIPRANTKHPIPSNLAGTEGQNVQLPATYNPSPENASVDVSPVSVPKNDLQHSDTDPTNGGNYTSRSSSPLSTLPAPNAHAETYADNLVVPEDNSTSPQPPLPASVGGRFRSLPRSPLFRFQNAATSPERRPESLIAAPLPDSQASTQEAFIWRAPRRPNRAFRHQTNSFSFDDSVRASAAYEQDRISSASTADSTSLPRDHTNLREELRGTSLESERISSGGATSVTGALEGHNAIQELEFRRGRIYRSVELPLPPPFSTVPRNTSVAGSLPSLPDEGPLGGTAGVRERATSPSKQELERISLPTLVNHASIESTDEGQRRLQANSSSPAPSARGVLNSAARPISSSRSQPPSNRSESSSLDSTPRMKQTSSPKNPNTQTPSRSYRIYNDQVSPGTQPQTPAHLPEARHRSRFHPSYTAPVARARVSIHSIDSGDGTNDSVFSPHGRARGTPWSARRAGRSRSPIGLLNQGFRGLYGGRENGDEEENWVEGVRFSNAETRLWGARDASGDGRSLRETPEREVWRIGRE